MSNRLVILLLLAFGLKAGARVEAADWPRWRGPDLDGISKETGWSARALANEPKILWRARLGTGFASFVVADGRVFTTGNAADTDTLFCFDAETGREVWKISYAEPLDPKSFDGGTSATPTVDGGSVYQLSRQGLLLAADAQTGKELWKKNVAKEIGAEIPQWGFASSPYIHGDLLVVNVGKLGTGLDKKTGKLVWNTGRDVSGYATPVPFEQGGRKWLAILGARELASLDPLTGRLQWSYPWKTSYDVNATDPVFQGNRVFISTGYGTGGALLDLASGRPKPVWANKNMHNQFCGSVLINGDLYGISGQAGQSGDSGLTCVEFSTGKLKWKEKSLMFGAMTATTDKLIAIGEKGELVIAEVNPNQFVALARAQILGGRCWTRPVLANGRIYVRNSRGDMVCVDVKS